MAAPVGANNVTYKNAEKLLATGSISGFRSASYYEAMIRKRFANYPVMVRIARCESDMRQYDEKGQPLRGGINPHDIGLLQINEDFHGKKAESMGYNIYTDHGNLDYGDVLLKTEGLRPWSLSRRCWGAENSAKFKIVGPVLSFSGKTAGEKTTQSVVTKFGSS